MVISCDDDHIKIGQVNGSDEATIDIVSLDKKGTVAFLNEDSHTISIALVEKQSSKVKTTLEVSQTVQRMDYIEKEKLLCLCCFESQHEITEAEASNSQFFIFNIETQEIVYSRFFLKTELPSAVSHRIDSDYGVDIVIYLGITFKNTNTPKGGESGKVEIIVHQKKNGQNTFKFPAG